MSVSRRALAFEKPLIGLRPLMVLNRKSPPTKRGRLSSKARISVVNGMAWAAPFFILLGGITHSPSSISDHSALAASSRLNAQRQELKELAEWIAKRRARPPVGG